MLVPAIVIITLALIFYTVGVWSERVQGILKPWHAGMFALGLACDATGTWMMTQIATERLGEGIQPGALSSWMAISGTIAIILMGVHLVWAVVVLVRNREREKLTFHTFSLAVWVVWLASYLIGAASAMV